MKRQYIFIASHLIGLYARFDLVVVCFGGGSKFKVNIGILASNIGRNNRISDLISSPKFPSIFVIILSF